MNEGDFPDDLGRRRVREHWSRMREREEAEDWRVSRNRLAALLAVAALLSAVVAWLAVRS